MNAVQLEANSLEADKVHLVTNGTLELSLNGVPVQLRSSKARALIAFLALGSTKRSTREEICDLLWPEKDPSKARGSLRQCLTALKRALGNHPKELIILDGEQVSLNFQTISSDVDELSERLEQSDTSHETLQLCLQIPRFLADTRAVSPKFEEWVDELLLDYHQRVQQLLRKIYDNEHNASAIRLRCAQTALKIDPFDEGAIRASMRALVKNGEAAAALRTYSSFFEHLENEMDVEPSIETQDLAVAIKLADTTVDVPSAAQVPSDTIALSQAPVSLAILPFEVSGPIENARGLSLTLLEHLTCHFASFKSLSVISSNTTRMYFGKVLRPQLVGKELNVRNVLTGSVRLGPDNAALTVELVEAHTERVIWAKTQLSPHDEILKLNIPISQGIARAILPSLEAHELRLSRSIPEQNLEPYQLVLQAKDLMFKLGHNEFVDAGRLLKKAVQIGPEFSLAQSLMADWLSIRLREGWSHDVGSDRMSLDYHVGRALSLDPEDGRVMALWAHTRMMFDRDYDGALKLLDKAVELSPNDAETLVWSVQTLAMTGRQKDAVDNGRRAIELSPFDPFAFRYEHFLSFALFAAGAFDEAAEFGLSSYRQAPTYSGNTRTTIAALTAAGRHKEAKPLVEHHMNCYPEFSLAAFEKVQGFREPTDRSAFVALLAEAGLRH